MRLARTVSLLTLLASITGTAAAQTAAANDGIAFDLDEFEISDFAGIEFYPDNAVAPSQFAHTSKRCGLLLLWTRER